MSERWLRFRDWLNDDDQRWLPERLFLFYTVEKAALALITGVALGITIGLRL